MRRGVVKVRKVFLTEKELAEIGLKSPQSLRNDRWKGVGIPFYRIGRSVRYAVADVRKYLEENKIEPNQSGL